MNAALQPKALTTKQATALFDELHGALVNTERVIIKIIETQAWIPLGYGTFAEAWASRMAGVRLATDGMRAHVIYALLDTMNPAGIEELTGASASTISLLQRQKSIGVPPGFAFVKQHYRRAPCGDRTVRVVVTADEYGAWSEAAQAAGSTVSAEAETAIRARFAELTK